MSVDLLAEGALPSGWEKVSLGLFRQQTTSSFNPAAHGTSHFELYSVPSHELGRPEVVLGSAIGSNKQYVAPGDVLISKINPRLNRAWVVGNFTNHPKIASTEWIVFKRSDAVDSQLLCGILQSFRIRDFLAHNASGVGGSLTRAKPALVDQITIGLPPVAEQQRIVAKIEELFSELDKGIESLKTAQAQLKVYRQALLKHAFEGKLTTQWRADNPDKLETAAALQQRIARERETRYQQQLADWQTAGQAGPKPKPPKPLPPLTAEELAELPELPKGWGWFSLGAACFDSVLGKMLDKEKNKGELKPYLRNVNVRWGSFELDGLLEMRFEQSEFQRYSLVEGDLVICEGGEPGRCAVWKEALGSQMYVQKALHRVRFTSSVDPYFVQLYFEYAASNRRLEHLFTGTTIKHLTGEKLARFALPLCQRLEQTEVIAELESKLSEADQLDQTLTTALQQAEALRQSILKKAFSAQLVPQDPTDEPAASLLARIKAEQSAAPKAKKARK